jgi:hypothetical protein
VTTWSLDRNASARLEAARRQHEMAQQQREELIAQCGQLDKRIPTDAATSLERRLVAAEAEVDRLEALATREGSMHLLADRITAAEQAVARAMEDRKAAMALFFGTGAKVAALSMLFLTGGALVTKLSANFASGFNFDRKLVFSANLLPAIFGHELFQSYLLIFPLMLLTAIVAIAATGATGGFLFASRCIRQSGFPTG